MLSANNLHIGFVKNKEIVSIQKNIHFQFLYGKLILLVGANGIGKSTLIKTILGLEKMIEGNITLEKTDISNFTPAQIGNSISVCFSTSPYLPMVTVIEAIESACINENIDELRLRFLFNELQINHLKQKLFSELSDGEKQKIMIVRSLIKNTPIVFLDEPLAFLDYPSRKITLQLLKNEAEKNNKLIVFSSHDLELSLQFAHEICIMKKNSLVHYTQKPTLTFITEEIN